MVLQQKILEEYEVSLRAPPIKIPPARETRRSALEIDIISLKLFYQNLPHPAIRYFSERLVCLVKSKTASLAIILVKARGREQKYHPLEIWQKISEIPLVVQQALLSRFAISRRVDKV